MIASVIFVPLTIITMPFSVRVYPPPENLFFIVSIFSAVAESASLISICLVPMVGSISSTDITIMDKIKIVLYNMPLVIWTL